ncbi:MOSC domain-containing protein [Spirosoma fluminis]
MEVLSVNVGTPATITWGGRVIETGIYKQPTPDKLAVTSLNIAGDAQADLTVHGGLDKAVYAYDVAHYAYWQEQLPVRTDWSHGLFGENLTTAGLLDDDVCIGDLYRIGSVTLRAVQPRFPCYKLNARFDDRLMARKFSEAVRCGIYFRVAEGGCLQQGDRIQLLEQSPYPVTIRDVADWYLGKTTDQDALQALLALPHLPAKLKSQFKRMVG